MHLHAAHSILDLCLDSGLKNTLDLIFETLSTSETEKEKLTNYYYDIHDELKELATSYLSIIEELDESDAESCENQFMEQLSYLWIHLQSDWIRHNNFSNFKFSFTSENDKITQGKASICSIFLQPIGKILDPAILDQNMSFIRSLLNRSLLSTS